MADALGVPYEFSSRGFCDENPMTDMIGFGTYNQRPGTWSDDSSLALAALDGLTFSLKSNKDNMEDSNIDISEIIDYEDIMKRFSDWLVKADYSPYGEVFDVGITTRRAIEEYYWRNCKPLLCGGDYVSDCGNGSLMRILPIAFFIYFLSLKYSFSQDDMMNAIHNLSSLTHRHERCKIVCGTYVLIAIELLKNSFEDNGLSLEELVANGIELANEYYSNDGDLQDEYNYLISDEAEKIFKGDLKNVSREEVSGKGYVITSFEAALWCLLNNDSYRETALAAVNLGDDTDTTAAIAGGLAGIYYGYDDIPSHWLEQIAKFDYIDELIDSFSDSL